MIGLNQPGQPRVNSYCEIPNCVVSINSIQGWKFSDFSLISDFFTSTILKIIFEISSEENFSHDI